MAALREWADIKRGVESMISEARKHVNASPHSFHVSKDGSHMFYLGNTPTQPNTQQLLAVSLLSADTSPQPVLPRDWSRVGGSGTEKLSKEEELLRERKREKTTGINSYSYDREHNRFLFASGSSLYVLSLPPQAALGTVYPTLVPTAHAGARINPKFCPTDPDLVSFVRDGNVWVCRVSSGKELQLTNASNDGVTAGSPPYIIQEEFDRFTGYWWCPKACEGGKLGILFEEVDERMVEKLYIPQQGGPPEPHHYPFAGKTNAEATVRLVEFSADLSSPPRILSLPCTLKDALPWFEYLVRIDWLPEGDRVALQLLNRKQDRLSLVVFPTTSFASEAKEPTSTIPDLHVVLEENTHIWVNVSHIAHFFPSADKNAVRLIWASEKTGFRHLHLVTSLMNADGKSEQTRTAITSGEWQVEPDDLWVDETAGTVYFNGTKLSPLKIQLYKLESAQGFSDWLGGKIASDSVVWKELVQVTSSDFTHRVEVDTDAGIFVDVFSSPSTPPSAAIFKLEDASAPVSTFWSLPAVLGYQAPEIFSFQGPEDTTFYGQVWEPPAAKSAKEGTKFPCVWFVYGGPCEQLVTYAYRGSNFLRYASMAQMGYYVVMLDGRGSNRRGLMFEGHIKHRMGTVEIQDQVLGVRHLVESGKYAIDPERIAIHGWSYGGYMSLMGIAQRPDVFKIAIAGAPVTTWHDYDTGYTERYMGHPDENVKGYRDGSVIELAKLFPDGPNRLLIIHGACDENVLFTHTSKLVTELINCGKPHVLQVYPQERHGIRSLNSSIHYETLVLDFLQRYL